MTIDRYTKFVLTYIAICLSLITLKEMGFVSYAYAQQLPIPLPVVICDHVAHKCADVRPAGNGSNGLDGLVITVPR